MPLDNDNEHPSLYHAGVKGMKWGVRKDRKSSGSSRRAAKKRSQSSDHAQSRRIRKKKTYQLSNNELRKLNNRLELEATNRRLTSGDFTKGLTIVSTILGVVSIANQVVTVPNSPIGQLVGAGVDRLRGR